MAKRMNVQIAAWCHFYWKDTNPGGEKFYRKFLDRAFNQVLLHKISKCERDTEAMAVLLPHTQSEMSAVMEFGIQDWVKNIAKVDQSNLMKKHVDPNVVFPFHNNFSVGAIHGKNTMTTSKDQAAGTAPKDMATVKEIIEDKDDIRVLTTKTQDKLLALLVQERQKSKSTVSIPVASSSDPPIGGLIANTTPAGLTRTAHVVAEGSQITPSAGTKGRVDGRPTGK